jgi:hypothetical protein
MRNQTVRLLLLLLPLLAVTLGCVNVLDLVTLHPQHYA